MIISNIQKKKPNFQITVFTKIHKKQISQITYELYLKITEVNHIT